MAETFLERSSRRVTSAPSLGQLDVHVWTWDLCLDPRQLSDLQFLLSPDELTRARRFHFARHRSEYIAGRAILRQILGLYLGVNPVELEFHYGPYGKPFLSREGLEFNLSHSSRRAVLALGVAGPLGVDIEMTRLPPEADLLVEQFFSRREFLLFKALPPPEKPQAFTNLWTRKEAWLKATGQGISHLLSHVDVSFLPGEPAELLDVRAPYFSASEWDLRDLEAGANYTAALACQAGTSQVQCFSLDSKYD